MKKTTQLRQLLHSQQLEFLLEAHNGISAKIVEEAQFKGIWASGLGISAQLGVRDNNEASWTQVLEVIEFMSDATSIPILLDGDTGYGNFNNLRRLVKKLEQRDIAGVCIEDKLFPKTNSFINGTTQPLAEMEEFCGKIKAAKDAQSDDDFVVIARIEALIAGWGLTEALKRATAYTEAGADGILIHSASSMADEILAFKREWGDRAPVIIVPTKYYSTPTSIFQDYNFAIVIWANHLLRAAVTTMQTVAKTIHQEANLLSIEDTIVPVSEVFRLQDSAELLQAEQRYLPHFNLSVGTILLAASRGIEFGELTQAKPKCMLTLQGQPLLAQVVDSYDKVGIKNISVVRGYQKQAVNLPNLHYVDNDRYDCTGELVSLATALAAISLTDSDWIIGYGDVLLKQYILQLLLETTGELAIVVDANWRNRSPRVRPDYVNCSLVNSTEAFYTKVFLREIGSKIPEQEICGLWTGLLKISGQVKTIFQETVTKLLQQPLMESQGRMPDLINEFVREGCKIEVIYITGHWLDVDEIEDILKVGNF
ncbi:MAG: phosphoenolpyruvate mutase [Oscillatoria sp. PMC 1051.18]|nr:phosphoenolpyruvate mutase [Oscillatoria sp. PMC 1050.18]MEC5032372.1 phosphoenolpyruvate mutase [Oscillatoria sp. PMC 1051.18]